MVNTQRSSGSFLGINSRISRVSDSFDSTGSHDPKTIIVDSSASKGKNGQSLANVLTMSLSQSLGPGQGAQMEQVNVRIEGVLPVGVGLEEPNPVGPCPALSLDLNRDPVPYEHVNKITRSSSVSFVAASPEEEEMRIAAPVDLENDLVGISFFIQKIQRVMMRM